MIAYWVEQAIAGAPDIRHAVMAARPEWDRAEVVAVRDDPDAALQVVDSIRRRVGGTWEWVPIPAWAAVLTGEAVEMAWILNAKRNQEEVRPMLANLTPCPFCESPDIGMFFDQRRKQGGGHQAQCRNCGAAGPRATSPERAAELWAERCATAGAARPPVAAELMLAKFPDFDPTWPMEARTGWLQALGPFFSWIAEVNRKAPEPAPRRRKAQESRTFVVAPEETEEASTNGLVTAGPEPSGE